VRIYYQQFEEQQTQSIIDQRIKEHLGQTAAFQQVGAAYNQHLMVQRPRLPVLPTPVMPIGGNNAPLFPGMRPPVLPRPMPGAPGKLHPKAAPFDTCNYLPVCIPLCCMETLLFAILDSIN
jgi:U1 small nuclear ribonucleoprotein C